MNWANRRALVTGAGGFIGSHLVERLVELGAKTRAFVHYGALASEGWLQSSKMHQDIEIFSGDICDRESLAIAMQDVDVVFHLAALIAIPYSYRAPGSYVRTNVEGTLTVLQLAKELGISRVVHTSTSEVYGTAQYVPIDERHPLQGQSPYSASKIGADKLAEAFYCSYGLPVATVRPFNTFGPRQSARAIVPTIISQCLSRGIVRLGNQNPTRDLNFVTDTVEGFILATDDAAIGRTINLGSGQEVAIGELAERIARIIGKDIEIHSTMERMRPARSEVERLVADSTLANTLLGWSSTVSLNSGLERTIPWIEKNLERYKPDAYVI